MLEHRPSSLSGLPLATVAVLAIALVAWAIAGAAPRRGVRAESASLEVVAAEEPSSPEPLGLVRASSEPAPPSVIAEAMTLAFSGVESGRAAVPLAVDDDASAEPGPVVIETPLEGGENGEREATGPRADGQLQDGLPHGEWSFRYENGTLLAEGRFETGLPAGEWQWWHLNGRERLAGSFENGLAEGGWLAWHENGAPLYETAFLAGEEEGPRTEWHQNGRVQLQGESSKGLREGTWTTWYPSGAKESVTSYRKGLPDGRSVKWYENGVEMKLARYRNGRPQGRWEEWYSNGQLKEGGSFANGQRTGFWEFYHYDGATDRRTGTYKNGKRVR